MPREALGEACLSRVTPPTADGFVVNARRSSDSRVLTEHRTHWKGHALEQSLRGRTVLITGASRGIGADTARNLARKGARVIINYRDKARRAEGVAAEIREHGGEAHVIQADVTDPVSVELMLKTVKEQHERLDVLVLNASGGMERGADHDYAMRLNRDAQVQLVERALPLMPAGSRVVFVTSHQAHFVNTHPTIPEYLPVAESKRAGEDALRDRIDMLRKLGVDLVVVSGDMIEGTITAKLLERTNPGTIDARKKAIGGLLSVEEFASEVAAAVTADVASGSTIYAGGKKAFA